MLYTRTVNRDFQRKIEVYRQKWIGEQVEYLAVRHMQESEMKLREGQKNKRAQWNFLTTHAPKNEMYVIKLRF